MFDGYSFLALQAMVLQQPNLYYQARDVVRHITRSLEEVCRAIDGADQGEMSGGICRLLVFRDWSYLGVFACTYLDVFMCTLIELSLIQEESRSSSEPWEAEDEGRVGDNPGVDKYLCYKWSIPEHQIIWDAFTRLFNSSSDRSEQIGAEENSVFSTSPNAASILSSESNFLERVLATINYENSTEVDSGRKSTEILGSESDKSNVAVAIGKGGVERMVATKLKALVSVKVVVNRKLVSYDLQVSR